MFQGFKFKRRRSSSSDEPSSSNQRQKVDNKSAMTALKDVSALYQQLKREWSKSSCDLVKCGNLLKDLKISLTHTAFLPTSDCVASSKELLVARDILEIGAQWSIATEDIPSFERYMAQLKCYYFDYKNELKESAFKYQLLGLNLLFLLSQNRVAEFHTELELLPTNQIQSNVFIRHPLSLEQYLMEGSYNKIFLAKGNAPASSYNFFMDILLNTVREEIGACLESAYDKISVKDAMKMLNLKSPRETIVFAANRNWNISKDGYFKFKASNEKQTEEPLPSTQFAALAIDYAREMEMIV